MHITSLCFLLLISVLNANKCVDSNIVIVNGIGRRQLKNSIAVISMRVESKARFGLPVQNKVYHRSKKLYDYLRFRRVQEATTTGIQFFGIYKFNPARVVGYQGRNIITFQAPVSRVASILRGAFANVKNDAKITRVVFKAEKKEVEKARNEALREAILAARTDASNTELPVGRVLRVRVTDNFLPQETVISSLRGNIRENLSVRFNVGVTNIQARVEITYDADKEIHYEGY